jgi:hypothetical protein
MMGFVVIDPLSLDDASWGAPLLDPEWDVAIWSTCFAFLSMKMRGIEFAYS